MNSEIIHLMDFYYQNNLNKENDSQSLKIENLELKLNVEKQAKTINYFKIL